MLGDRFRVDVILENRITHFVAYGFSLSSIIPQALNNHYKVIVDTTTGVRHVVQHVFMPHVECSEDPSTKTCVEDPNSENNVSTQQDNVCPAALVDDAILLAGKLRKLAPKDLDMDADSRSSSISILGTISPLFDKGQSNQASFRATSGTSFKLSPHAEDFIPDQKSPVDIDPAIISRSKPSKDDTFNPSPANPRGKTPLRRCCRSAAARGAEKAASNICDLDPATITCSPKPYIDATILTGLRTTSPKSFPSALEDTTLSDLVLDNDPAIVQRGPKANPSSRWSSSPEDAAFFGQLLGRNLQLRDSTLKEPWTWVDLQIDDKKELRSNPNVDCLEPPQVKLPLEEFCLHASDEQMMKMLDNNEQTGAQYEETLRNDENSGTDVVELRTPVRPREGQPTYDDLITTSDLSASSSLTEPSSPTSTSSTKTSNYADDIDGALGVKDMEPVHVLGNRDCDGKSYPPNAEISSRIISIDGPKDATNEALVPEAFAYTDNNLAQDSDQAIDPQPFVDQNSQIEGGSNSQGEALSLVDGHTDGGENKLEPSKTQSDLTAAKNENISETGFTASHIEEQLVNLYGPKPVHWADEADVEDLAVYRAPHTNTAANQNEVNPEGASKVALKEDLSRHEDSTVDKVVHDTLPEDVQLEEVAPGAWPRLIGDENINRDGNNQETNLPEQPTSNTLSVNRISGFDFSGHTGKMIPFEGVSHRTTTPGTAAPPLLPLPSIYGHFVEMFNSEFKRLWNQGNEKDAWIKGQDELYVQALVQAHLESNHRNVPSNLISIVNDVNVKYRELLSTCGDAQKYGKAHLVATYASVQWQYLHEDLKKLQWNRSILEGVEPEVNAKREAMSSALDGSASYHINFNGDIVSARSATSPAISLWAIGTTRYKQLFPNPSHQPVVHLRRVLAAQAFKYVDPVQYLGSDDAPPNVNIGGTICYLMGTQLQQAVIGDVDVMYRPYGIWQYDSYGYDNSVPSLAHDYDKYHSAGMDVYTHLQRPCYIYDWSNEHHITNPKYIAKSKLGSSARACSTLISEAYNGTKYDLPIIVRDSVDGRSSTTQLELGEVEEFELEEESAYDGPRSQNADPGYVSEDVPAESSELVDEDIENLMATPATSGCGGRSILAEKMFESQQFEEEIDSPVRDVGSWEENEDGGFDSPTKPPTETHTDRVLSVQKSLDSLMRSPSSADQSFEDVSSFISMNLIEACSTRSPLESPTRRSAIVRNHHVSADDSTYSNDDITYLTPTRPVISSVDTVSEDEGDGEHREAIFFRNSFMEKAKKDLTEEAAQKKREWKPFVLPPIKERSESAPHTSVKTSERGGIVLSLEDPFINLAEPLVEISEVCIATVPTCKVVPSTQADTASNSDAMSNTSQDSAVVPIAVVEDRDELDILLRNALTTHNLNETIFTWGLTVRDFNFDHPEMASIAYWLNDVPPRSNTGRDIVTETEESGENAPGHLESPESVVVTIPVSDNEHDEHDESHTHTIDLTKPSPSICHPHPHLQHRATASSMS